MYYLNGRVTRYHKAAVGKPDIRETWHFNWQPHPGPVEYSMDIEGQRGQLLHIFKDKLCFP